MPRKPRICPAGYPVHIIQRGNNRRPIFNRDTDIAAYAHWLHEGAIRLDVQIHSWVFMTNHVHLLATPGREGALSRLMQSLGRPYVRYFNFSYARSGTLYEGRFRSSVVEEDRYLIACLRYIELNPVRAGLVKDPGDYHWSSYRAHALGVTPSLWTPHRTYRALGPSAAKRQERYRNLVRAALDQSVMAQIRHCGQSGLVLGGEEFRARVAQETD